MNDLRVLHLFNALRPSGMERMLVSAAPYFSELRISSEVVGQGLDNPFENELRDAGHLVHTIPAISESGGREWQMLLRHRLPDIIHIHSEQSYLKTIWLARRALPHVPIVRTVHGIFKARGRWRLSRQAQSLMGDRFVSDIVACSSDVRDNELRIRRHAKVVFNWVDDRFYDVIRPAPNASAPLLVLVVGNCSSVKQHEYVLEPLLSSEYLVAHFGDEVAAASKEKELLDRLYATGRLVHRGVGDPSSFMDRAGVFVLPSAHEGMSVALAEAVVAGVPSLVNDVEGLGWARNLDMVRMVPDDPGSWNAMLSTAGRSALVKFASTRG